MTLELMCSAHTDIGSRDKNQDAFLIGINTNDENEEYADVCTTKGLKLFAVCDGVGGFPRSEYASGFGVRFLNDELKKYNEDTSMDEWLLDVADELHKSMQKYLLSNLLSGGTTLTLLAIKEDKYCLLNVGDSPAYLISDSSINQLSKNQTLAEYKLAQKIEPQPEDYHILLFCVGYSRESMHEMAYVTKGVLKKGDVIILCTDGVSNCFNQEELRKKVEEGKDAEYFVSQASQSENSDNCTAVVIDVTNSVNN